MIGIVVSRADEASVRIGEAILEQPDWTDSVDESTPDGAGGGTVYRSRHFELREFERLHLELASVAETFSDPSVVLFVSRHSGETGKLLSTHFPGNVANAEYGGAPGELPRAAPATLREVFRAFEDVAPEGYEVGVECTHHGPSRVGAPCLFVELGSSPSEWGDPDGAGAIADAILSLSDQSPGADRTVVGFGGGHYAPRFARLLRETDWCLGHIAADWALQELGDRDDRRAVIADAFERSGATRALLDGDDPTIRETIRSLGYRVVSETWLREADGVPLDVVDAIEDVLGGIQDGVRLGAQVEVDPRAASVVHLPGELLRIVQGIDRQEAISRVAERVIAYDTTENGSRLAGPLLLPSGDTCEDVVAALVPILEERFDTIRLSPETVALTERTFDPDAARSLGVTEGRAFGRLADGEPVVVDGREVEPAEVTRTATREIPLSSD